MTAAGRRRLTADGQRLRLTTDGQRLRLATSGQRLTTDDHTAAAAHHPSPPRPPPTENPARPATPVAQGITRASTSRAYSSS
jgi:hypothetical protein